MVVATPYRQIPDAVASFEVQAKIDAIPQIKRDLIEEAERAEQERIAAEARAEEERAQKVIHDAAAKIQALYRGFRERQELANPKGKGKGKGKKKR